MMRAGLFWHASPGDTIVNCTRFAEKWFPNLLYKDLIAA